MKTAGVVAASKRNDHSRLPPASILHKPPPPPPHHQQHRLLLLLQSTNKASLSSSRRPHLVLLPKTNNTRSDHGIITLRYEHAAQANPPIPVTVAPPRSPPQEEHPAFRSRPTDRSAWANGSEDIVKRDSVLGSTAGSENYRGTTTTTTTGSVRTLEENALGLVIDFDIPTPMTEMTTETGSKSPTMEQNELVKRKSVDGDRGWKVPESGKNGLPKTPDKEGSQEEFSPITTPIPTDSLMEDGFLDDLSFSNRGSVMFGGKKAVNRPKPQARTLVGRRKPSVSMLASPTINILPDDVEKESQKVRSMYEQGNVDWEDGSTMTSQTNVGEVLAIGNSQPPNDHLSPLPTWSDRPGSALTTRSEYRREFELAGGIEDWEDVQGPDVDRYGFINMRRVHSRPGTPEPRPPQRVSTALQLVSETPRKKRAFGRSPSTATSPNKTPGKGPSRKVSAKSLRTQRSSSSQISTRASLRAATNRLPGNRDRRWMDEAGDMLTLPPGLADIAEDEEGGKAAATMKRKEFERTEKWRKMAKVVRTGKDGEGMHFEFDTKNPKLIERTWKGIPDRWRSEAWFSFLSTSAKKRKDSPTDEAIIAAFHKLLDTSSGDDVQIDIDVPRTINSHIMFRRRYRGGQRLLFRVLHCLSLYFPTTGYVQGMASLAATLLCYFDEEKCFIMLVRMWTLRGLDKLYEPGFGGLMACLDEFQKSWLDNNTAVASNLLKLGIDTTAYGTRWYLTLFNYSIPFPAQLRVWDVFILLGDSDPSLKATEERPFQGGLDVLHATGAALIDGTREILLDSDFENAMKVLTGWIPVRDEELLMRVVGVEWRAKARRGR